MTISKVRSYLNSSGQSKSRCFCRMDMGECNRKGVGFVRLRRSRQPERCADHERNLGFVGAAAPDGRLFYAGRGVLKNWKPAFRSGEHCRAARRTEEDRNLMTLHVNYRLHRAAIRLEFADQIDQPITNRDQAARTRQD